MRTCPSLVSLVLLSLAAVSVACEGDTIYYIVGSDEGTTDSSVEPEASTPDAAIPDADVREEIVVGFLAPDAEGITGPVNRAAQLAIDTVNEAGGLLDGRRVRLELQQQPPDGADNEFRALIEAGAVGIVGPFDLFPANSVIPIAAAAEVPFFGVYGGASLNWVASQETEVWGRSNFKLPLQSVGAPIMEFMKNTLECSTVGGIHIEDISPQLSEGLLELAASLADDAGLTYTMGVTLPFRPGDSSEALAGFADPPDCVMIESPIMAHVIRDAPDGFTDAKLVLAGDLIPPFISDIADTLEDYNGAHGFSEPQLHPERNQEYLTAYEAVYGETLEPSTHFFMSNSYDYMALLLLAIEQAGTTDGAAVRDAIVTVGASGDVVVTPSELVDGLTAIRNGMTINYQGATGDVDFSNGAVSTPAEPFCYVVTDADTFSTAPCE